MENEIKGYLARGTHPTDGQFSAWIRADALVATWCEATCRGVTDIRIYAVAEDGTETPLPTYDEALAQWSEDARQMQALYEETHRALDAAISERDALRAERDARDKAWARLVRAEVACASAGYGIPSDATVAEYEAAEQALRDLGVDIDALLGDG